MEQSGRTKICKKKLILVFFEAKVFVNTIFPLLRALCLPPTGYYLPGSLSVVYHFSWEMAHEFACIYFHKKNNFFFLLSSSCSRAWTLSELIHGRTFLLGGVGQLPRTQWQKCFGSKKASWQFAQRIDQNPQKVAVWSSLQCLSVGWWKNDTS